MLIFLFAQTDPTPIYNGPVTSWQTAFLIALPSILAFLSSLSALWVGYLNHKNINTNSSKSDMISDKQDALAHRVNGLTSALVQSSKDEGKSAGLLEGVQIEQARVASNLATADAARLEEIRESKKAD
jgi:hypothetical protein